MNWKTWGSLVLLLASCAPQARPVPPTPTSKRFEVTTADADGLNLLRDTSRSAEAAGAAPVRLLDFGAAQAGDRVEGIVFVPQQSCALFLARASGSVDDLDLHIYGDDGTQYAVDESPDDLPTLLLCPEAGARLFVSARVAQGHGLVALGVVELTNDVAESVAQAVGARNFSREPHDLDEAWPGLEAAVLERREQLGGNWRDVRRVAIPVDGRVPSALTLEVPKNRCVDALFLPSQEVSQLQVSVINDRGRKLGLAERIARTRAIVLCGSSRTEKVTLEIRPFVGRGLTVAVLSESKGAAKATDFSDVRRIYLDESVLHQASNEIVPPVFSLRLRRGQVHSRTIQLSGCGQLFATGRGGLAEYSLQAWDEQGALLGSSLGRGQQSLYVCTKGEVRIDAESQVLGGQLDVGLVEYEEQPRLALQLPLAAGRLLQLAASVGSISEPVEIGQLNRVELEESRLMRFPISVPAAHCQKLFVAGDHGSWGLEARVIDKRNQLELDRAQGRSSLELRACAPQGGHLNAQVELRSISGSTSAFWSQRQFRLGD